MDTAWNYTFSRTTLDGDTQLGIIGTLGASAFNVTMNQMQLEVPMFTLTEAIYQEILASYNSSNDTINTTICEDIYTQYYLLLQNQSIGLCTNSTFFNFSDIFQSSLAMVNTYLYAGVYNPQYYNDFMPAIGLNASDPNDVATFNILM